MFIDRQVEAGAGTGAYPCTGVAFGNGDDGESSKGRLLHLRNPTINRRNSGRQVSIYAFRICAFRFRKRRSPRDARVVTRSASYTDIVVIAGVAHCWHCHRYPRFATGTPRILGLPIGKLGRGQATFV